MSDDVGAGEVVVKRPDPEDERFVSVTTILKALAHDALTFWAVTETAKAAVSVAGSLAQRIQEDGTDEVVRWLEGARWRGVRGARTATELGTAIHAACETYGLTGVRPDVDDEVGPYLDQFDKWAQTFQPQYEGVECAVYSRHYRYAGTCDGYMTVGGQRVIFDYKTSRKSYTKRGEPTGPYPEVALQLAAYRYAELAATWRARRYEKYRSRYYLLNKDESQLAVAPPEVDGGLVIHITPEHCTAYPVRCGPDMFNTFLYVIEASRFIDVTSKLAIGEPLTPVREV
jgi:hypothetical protein